MSCVQLADYLSNAKHFGTHVEVLQVPRWLSSSWIDEHRIVLAHLCRLLKVKKLIFGDEMQDTTHAIEFLIMLKMASSNPTTSYPFLSDLKEIEIMFIDECPLLWEMLHNSSVKRIDIDMNHVDATQAHIVLDEVNDFLSELLVDTLANNFHLQEIWVDFPWAYQPISFSLEESGVFTWSEQGEKVETYLKRNRKGWQKCLKATTILFGLRKQKILDIDRNVLKLVINMVWETRGTKVWTQEDPQ
jgi:hypothetical protein